MVYELSYFHLEKKRGVLLKEFGSDGVTNIDKLAEALFYSACIKAKHAGIGRDHPTIKAIEGTYSAVIKNEENDKVKVAHEIMKATAKLDELVLELLK